MKAIVTICSKPKDNSNKDMPAYLRYTSPRIKEVMEIASKENAAYFILSGKFGLIKHDKPISFYDHLLLDKEINEIAKLVSRQILDNNIDAIDFYAKPKLGDWITYYKVIERATNTAEASLNICLL